MREFLERQFKRRARVAVLGDSMRDEYHNVISERVSPEFPIPVMLENPDFPKVVVPGGAGNVCRQFVNFNFEVELFSLIDSSFPEIIKGVGTEGCKVMNGVIPTKSRFYSGNFPLFRLDKERKSYGLESSDMKEISNYLISSLVKSDPYEVIILSDYDKGIFRDVEPFIHRLPESTITIVDPKRCPIERWKGCSIIKPNANEARTMSGSDDWRRQCEYFIGRTGCQAVVITQAGEGVVGNVMGSWFEYRPEFPSSPVSVIGAGDAFVAFLAMGMAHSIDIRDSVKLAFQACSTYVQKRMNQPIFPYELESSKLVLADSLVNRDFELSFTNGCFDILHPGHIELFKFARGRTGRLAVAINSDGSVARQSKSHPMINELDHRVCMLSSVEHVDFVLVFDEDTPYELIRRIRPDVLVKGSDWPNPVGSEIVREVCSFGLVGNYSTTSIIEKIIRLKFDT